MTQVLEYSPVIIAYAQSPSHCLIPFRDNTDFSFIGWETMNGYQNSEEKRMSSGRVGMEWNWIKLFSL